ncbi:MAG: DUF1178 family protein [Sneathiella sp.]|uniref:DUF1178 family protein n=1 Tax=Sneathiella sp. TaxID=1964365 RepID=UPI0030028939
MIKYDLKCDNAHIFEAWFKNSATYDAQVGAGGLACAVCGATGISKAPMAPSVPKKNSLSKNDRQAMAEKETNQAATMMKAMREIRETVEKNFDNVGDQFAEEARKIHYGETETRGIYGQATTEESSELREEGVEINEIPWIPSTDN